MKIMIGKYLSSLIYLLFFLITACNVKSVNVQNDSVDSKVNSYFTKNILSIKNKLSNNLEDISEDEINFIYLYSFMADDEYIEIESYTGQLKNFDLDDLKRVENWYEKNKSKIDWDLHIQGGKYVINNLGNYDFDDLIKTMDSLKITAKN